MNMSITFIRVVFTLLSIIFFTVVTSNIGGGMNVNNLLIGVGSGLLFSTLLLGIEYFYRRTNLKALNTFVLGLFFGCLLAQGLVYALSGILELGSLFISPQVATIVVVSLYLFSIYSGIMLTIRAADEIHISIPFIKFQPTTQKKKDILLESSVLLDPRIIDLAASGILNNLLVLPQFIIKEQNQIAESPNDSLKGKARRALEVIKKLETMPQLQMRYNDTDFPEIKDTTAKAVRLARLTDSSILTADINRIEQSSIEGITVINIHMLANSLKPISQSGEYITIKVQRYGKEARQGVGYLEDGTMVVINGGAEYIGETIKAQVLSVKHTSSGRMIFCNTAEQAMLSDEEVEESLSRFENASKGYYTS
jgi:uncharacterized protein YacL